MVELLTLKGADRDAMDRSESTPLFLAVCGGHHAAEVALLAAGADVSLLCGWLKESVVHVAARHGLVEALRAVIEHGDVDAVDREQYTALHVAVQSNQGGTTDVLIVAGANIEARTRFGETPLHVAVSELSFEALRGPLETWC